MNTKYFFLLSMIFLISVSGVIADTQGDIEHLEEYESITYQITIQGNFDLIEESGSSSLQSATAQLLLKVQEDNNYVTLTSESTSEEGEITSSGTTFTFTDLEPLEKEIMYSATVSIDSSMHQITETAVFPIELTEDEIEEQNLEEYLEITETIDWDNEDIKLWASNLAQGQTDLFETLVTLASWVETNVEYNLSTLNAETSQKASHVLDTREGVCDEMTSLFISFARSLGIPARFVSGLTYTNSDLFDEPWQSHGWAEVYIPNQGWVSFDPTFGQYGFVDVTHIPLQYSNDPSDASIFYEWTARNLNLESGDIDFEVEVIEYGQQKENSFSLEVEHFAQMVNFGSYNLINAEINNQRSNYQAVELHLVAPEEISTVENVEVIVIGPQETFTAQWIVEVEEDLRREYVYTFPYYIFINSRANITSMFSAAYASPSYSYNEMEALLHNSEDMTINTELSMICDYPKFTRINEPAIISCDIENEGNQIIEDTQICIAGSCQYHTILLAETIEVEEQVTFSEAGFQNVQTSIFHDDFRDSDILSIQIIDPADIALTVEYDESISFDESHTIQLRLERKSISLPTNISLSIKTPLEVHNFEIYDLSDSEDITLELDTSKLTSKNDITVELAWEDELSETYEHSQQIQILVESNNFSDTITLFTNKILSLFMKS